MPISNRHLVKARLPVSGEMAIPFENAQEQDPSGVPGYA